MHSTVVRRYGTIIYEFIIFYIHSTVVRQYGTIIYEFIIFYIHRTLVRQYGAVIYEFIFCFQHSHSRVMFFIVLNSKFHSLANFFKNNIYLTLAVCHSLNYCECIECINKAFDYCIYLPVGMVR